MVLASNAKPNSNQHKSRAPPLPEPPLPTGWTKHRHETSGRPYYYNRGSGKTQWQQPVEYDEFSQQERFEDEASTEQVQQSEHSYESTRNRKRTETPSYDQNDENESNYESENRVTTESGDYHDDVAAGDADALHELKQK